MYLLDTNVISDMRRKGTPAESWSASADEDLFCFSVISMGELWRGISMKRRHDPATADILENWYANIRRSYAERFLPVTDEISKEWGWIDALRSRGTADGLIAATAMVHNLTLVSRNTKDFADLPISLLNPWDL
jgi:toxin FitB